MTRKKETGKKAGAGDGEASGAPVLIKKYPNRRLYNTATSSHIVLDDLVALVKSGQEFVVEDAKTGEDITRSILNQVIYEREANSQNHHFPLDVQKQLIAMYDDTYARMVPDYLRESMNLFVSQRDRIKENFEEMVNLNSQALTDFNENLARQNMEFFNKGFEFFQQMSGFAKPEQDDKTTAAQQPEDAPQQKAEQEAKANEKDNDLADMQAQINALQDQLKKLNK